MENCAAHEFNLADFSVVYQPIFNVRTGQIEKIEALMRWAKSGNVCGFIEHFEKTGQIRELTLHLIGLICEDMVDLRRTWDSPIVAINCSPCVLSDPEFVGAVINLFTARRVPPRCVEIELTEAERLNPAAVADGVRRLSENGYSISLDDFGAGATTLGCLVNMPIDVIKLDKCYVARIGESETIRAILSSIAYLSRAMGIACVVEGVETNVQMIFLKSINIDYAQGYLLAKPLSLNHLQEMLSRIQN